MVNNFYLPNSPFFDINGILLIYIIHIIVQYGNFTLKNFIAQSKYLFVALVACSCSSLCLYQSPNSFFALSLNSSMAAASSASFLANIAVCSALHLLFDAQHIIIMLAHVKTPNQTLQLPIEVVITCYFI